MSCSNATLSCYGLFGQSIFFSFAMIIITRKTFESILKNQIGYRLANYSFKAKVSKIIDTIKSDSHMTYISSTMSAYWLCLVSLLHLFSLCYANCANNTGSGGICYATSAYFQHYAASTTTTDGGDLIFLQPDSNISELPVGSRVMIIHLAFG